MARSLGLIGVVRQWIVKPVIPVAQSFRTRDSVISGVSKSRIFTLIPISNSVPTFLTRASRIEQSNSGVLKRAAPIPPLVLKDFGHPAFTSIPATSPATSRAAWTALSGSDVPNWNMSRRPSLSGCRRYMRLSFWSFRGSLEPFEGSRVKSTVERIGLTLRVVPIIDLSTVSGPLDRQLWLVSTWNP